MADLLHDSNHTRKWGLLRRAAMEFVANTRASAPIRRPISKILRRQIVILARQGMSTAAIANRVRRGEPAVVRVIAEELDHADRLWARLALQLGPAIVGLVAQMETRCRKESYEEVEVA